MQHSPENPFGVPPLGGNARLKSVLRTFVLRAALSLSVLLAVCLSDAAKQSSPTVEFTVMSYNIRFQSMDSKVERDGRLHRWDDRKAAVATAISQQNPDIIGLQEAQNPQRDYIAKTLSGYDFHASIFWKQDKFRKRDQGTFKLFGTGRTLDWARLEFKGLSGDLFLFNTHYPPAMKEPEKVKLCGFVADCINKTAGERSLAILTGDLNIHDDDSSGIRILRERAHLSDPWTDTGTSQRYTWNFWFRPTWSGSTVDWVLYRRPLRATRVERPAHTDKGEYPSDHLPVYVPLVLTREDSKRSRK